MLAACCWVGAGAVSPASSRLCGPDAASVASVVGCDFAGSTRLVFREMTRVNQVYHVELNALLFVWVVKDRIQYM